MIQSDFSGMIGSKTVRFSGSQFCFGVKALHNAAGKLLSGPKPASISERCRLSILATFFIGSICERIVLVHHVSRNRPAQ